MTMHVEIRAGDARDIAAILPIMNAAFDPAYGEAWSAGQCLSMLSLPGTHLHLAESEGKVVGFALTRGMVDEEELLLIAVEPRHARNRIATRLVQTATATARAIGRVKMFIEVRVNNPAIDFYRQIGFVTVGQRPDYYSGPDGRRLDATTMQLAI
jgi:[ribosomal protein S18]-alanine N-acetyltransferase